MVVVFDLCGHAKPAPGHADPWSITSIPEPAFQPHAQLSTAPGTTAVPPMIFSDAGKKLPRPMKVRPLIFLQKIAAPLWKSPTMDSRCPSGVLKSVHIYDF